jgi:hypothetical protein
MKTAYIVTEGKDNATDLQQLLPSELTQDITIVGAGSWYSAFSMAGTLMSDRSRPVILIVDANSDNPAQNQERTQTLTQLLRPAASTAPYIVILAIPTLAEVIRALNNLTTPEQIAQHSFVHQISQFLSTSCKQIA